MILVPVFCTIPDSNVAQEGPLLKILLQLDAQMQDTSIEPCGSIVTTRFLRSTGDSLRQKNIQIVRVTLGFAIQSWWLVVVRASLGFAACVLCRTKR